MKSIFSKAYNKLPHLLRTYPSLLSEQFKILSYNIYETPCANKASRSISPTLIPPCLFLPFIGYYVSISNGPVDLA